MQATKESGLTRLRRDQRGLSTVEYVILLCLIAGVSVQLWSTFGGHVNKALTKANKDFTASVPE